MTKTTEQHQADKDFIAHAPTEIRGWLESLLEHPAVVNGRLSVHELAKRMVNYLKERNGLHHPR